MTLADRKARREEAVQEERDALQPKVEAETQAWTAQMMQSGDYMAMSQQVMEYQQSVTAGASGQMETDPDCIALTSSNQASGLSQGVAPDVKAARVALVKSLEGKEGAAYTSAFPREVSGFAAALNAAIGKAAKKGASCADNRAKRSTVKMSKLSPSMKRALEINADAELGKLVLAENLARDLMSVCMTLDGLKDYASAGQPLTVAWNERGSARMAFSSTARAKVAMSSSSPVQNAVDQAKDSAIGKAVDKAFGSLFGR